MKHSCRYCEGPPQQRTLIRNGEDAAAFFACFDARWPPVVTRLRGLAVQLQRAVDAAR